MQITMLKHALTLFAVSAAFSATGIHGRTTPGTSQLASFEARGAMDNLSVADTILVCISFRVVYAVGLILSMA